MTSLTLVTVGVLVLGVVSSRGFGLALALGGATPVGAALVLGGIAVPTFYAVAVGAAVGLFLRLARRTRRFERLREPPVPGMLPLLLLVVWALLVTMIAPMLFDGLAVLNPRGISQSLAAGVITHSNVAQIGYLVLGVCVVAFLARSSSARPELIGTAAGLVTVLSLWSYLHRFGVPFPDGFFDNSPFFPYIETAPGGIERFRGILSEPSGLGGTSLVTISYMAARIPQVSGLRRVGTVLVLAVAMFLGFLSTSTTFLVAGVMVAVIAALTFLNRFVLHRGPLGTLGMTSLCAGVIVAMKWLPAWANQLGAAVSDKVTSLSYAQRSGADGYSLHLAFQTLGVGVGLGNNRASSFVASMLSTIGVIGVVLLTAAIWILVRAASPVPSARPVAWALLALLAGKVIAGPDLGDPTGILWISLGVLAHAAIRRRLADSAAVRGPAPATADPGVVAPASSS